MKRKIGLLLIALVSWAGMSAQGWYAGVEVQRMFEKDFEDASWEYGAFASYSRPIFLRLGFDVQAGLYAQYYNELAGFWVWDASPDDNSPRSTSKDFALTFGGRLGANLTLKIAGPISLFTGPSGKCNFFQKNYVRYNGETESFGSSGFTRAALQWKLGLTGDFKRFRVRAAWVRDLTGDEYDRHDGVNVSVAYRFK